MIKDSGARREFETGAVRDIQEGKGRCDLLPLDVACEYISRNTNIKELKWIHDFKETGDFYNLFKTLEKFTRVYCLRDEPEFQIEYDAHLLLEVSIKFEEGAKKYGENNWQKGIPTHCYIDSAVRHYLKFIRGDEDERHDRAFVWNILCCIWTCINKPELNDYAKGVDQ